MTAKRAPSRAGGSGAGTGALIGASSHRGRADATARARGRGASPFAPALPRVERLVEPEPDHARVLEEPGSEDREEPRGRPSDRGERPPEQVPEDDDGER